MKTNDFASETNENDVLTMNDYEILLNDVWMVNEMAPMVEMFLSWPETKGKTTEKEVIFYYKKQILGSFYRRIIGEDEFQIQYEKFINKKINFIYQ